MSKTFLILMSCALLSAQPQTRKKSATELLGYPADSKLLILHADDLAVSHSVDRASFSALDSRAVTSASIMVPCPWMSEAADYAKQHPDADLGLHLTLTSEWTHYRWGAVARQNLGGLLAPDGYFWPDTQPVFKNAKPEDVETEIRAQIESALKAGIRPTHLDSHMGTLLFSPVFFPIYTKVAREYNIPFFAARVPGVPPAMLAMLKDTDIVPDAAFMAAADLKPADWNDFYTRTIQSLKPGLTEIIVHLGYDNAELQAVTEGHPAYGSAWRQRDFDLVTSAEFRKLLRDNKVKLIGWKEIKEHWKP